MNHLVSHTRDIICYLSNKRLIYSIPIFYQQEKDYFKSAFFEIEINPEDKKKFILSEGSFKTLLHQPGTKPIDLMVRKSASYDFRGCCDKP